MASAPSATPVRLRGCRLLPLGPTLYQVHERHVVAQVIWRESGLNAADVTGREPSVLVDPASEELHTERTPGHKADTKLLASRDHFFFGTAPQHGIFVLDGGDGQRRMSVPQGLQSHLGQPPMQNLALVH